jgi:hypothetical protein
MKGRPPEDFAAVPNDRNGEPLLFTYDDESYHLYLNWLADYLYRSKELEPPLSFDEAWWGVGQIEDRIASWFLENPFETYPPGLEEGDPEFADFIHRVELSAILSRVHDHEQRMQLLDRFYSELWIDMGK